MNIQKADGTRGLAIKVIGYANEVWSEAQAKESKFKQATASKNIGMANYKLFQIAKLREAQRKGGGVVLTPRQTQEFDRRALFSESYHDSEVIDPDDEVDNQADILEVARSQMTKAFARICDRVILHSHVDPVQESEDSTADASNANIITASAALNKRWRGNAFAKVEGAAANAALKAITADDLEDIGYIFAKRDVEAKIVATLTPELQRTLRKDPDFKNAENTYATRDTGGMVKNIEYKGITFIQCSESVLPLISNTNIGGAAAGTRATAQKIAVRDLATAENVNPLLSTARVTKATLKTQTSAKSAEVTCRSTDLAYFWASEALYFASRDSLVFGSLDRLPNQSLAKQLYMRVNFGAMMIDDDYALTVPVRGTVSVVLS